MEVIGGLHHGAVARQKKLWAELPVEVTAGAESPCLWFSSLLAFFSPSSHISFLSVFNTLDELLSPQRNYSKLVTHVNALAITVPVLPYLGVYLKELALIHVGNQSFVDEAKTKVHQLLVRLCARC